jgi:hypothetical protein
MRVAGTIVGAALVAGTSLAADPWADQVIGYTPGVGVAPGYDQPGNGLGSPSRYSHDPVPEWSSVVSAFAPAYLPEQVASIGPGGSLTLGFDEPVTNDTGNPFGIDLLVFGNAFYSVNFVTGITNGALGGTNAAGVIEVSQDGIVWHAVPGVRPDSHFPTLGYSDLSDPFSSTPGVVEADFTRPVDPTFNAAGLDYFGVLAGYAGSGGGTGVSLDAVGLPWISFVRLSLPSDATGTIEVDGLSDVTAVPSPAALLLAPIAVGMGRRRRGG